MIATLVALMLSAAPDTSESPVRIAEVGGEVVYADARFAGVLPGTKYFSPVVGCRLVTTQVREVLVERVLRRLGVLPSEEEITKRLEGHLPSAERLARSFGAANRANGALAEALRRSLVDPTRDLEIWRELVSPYMTHDQWVKYRTTVKESEADIPTLPSEVSREAVLKAASGLRSMVREEIFQTWVRTRWRVSDLTSDAGEMKEGERGWNEQLQLAFWEAELSRTSVRIAPEWKCGPLTPRDLIVPVVTWPKVEKHGVSE